MKEYPILFSAPMVRAIRAGTKTQTRRLVKGFALQGLHSGLTPEFVALPENHLCPYGYVGDRLWVRETYMPDPPDDGTWAGTAWRGCDDSRIEDIPERFRAPDHCLYRATWEGHALTGWKPSIHMPRWACRLLLDVTAQPRIERLQDISIEDAKAEGAWPDVSIVSECEAYFGIDALAVNPYLAFRMIWERINGPESWAANPWVWASTFKEAAP